MIGWLLLFLTWGWIIFMGMNVPAYNFPEPLIEKFVIKTYEEQYCENNETKKIRVFKSVDQVKID